MCIRCSVFGRFLLPWSGICGPLRKKSYLLTWYVSSWEEFMPRSWHRVSLTNSKVPVDSNTFFVKMGHIWHPTTHVYPLLEVSNFFECIEYIIFFPGPNPLLCQDIIPYAVGLDDWQLATLTPDPWPPLPPPHVSAAFNGYIVKSQANTRLLLRNLELHARYSHYRISFTVNKRRERKSN